MPHRLRPRLIPIALLSAVPLVAGTLALTSVSSADAARTWSIGTAIRATAKPTPKPTASTSTTASAPKPGTLSSPALAASSPSPSTTTTTTPTYVFDDEFTGSAGTRPTDKWSYQTGGSGWGNNELESYTDRASNASLDGAGHLAITARKETFTGSDGITRSYTSARLFSNTAVSVGWAEARLYLPQGQGLWPAFWMLGSNITSTGWPICGEIDAVEALNSMSTAYGTIHGPDYATNTAYSYGSSTSPSGGLAGAWHTFAVSKTTTSITWYMDGVAYYTFTKSMLGAGKAWVFDQPQYLLLNLAVGGNWPGAPDATTPTTATLLVDWVRAGTGLPPDVH